MRAGRHPRDRVVRRYLQLVVGLALFGFSLAVMVRAELGLPPWDVLHQGVAERTPLTFGTVVIAFSILVMLLWIPLRQRPGTGTVANALLVGVFVDVGLWLLPEVSHLGLRIAMLAGGIALCGASTGLYVGAGLGPGPRDGLMTGLAARGIPLGAARVGIELTALAIGWVLGGTVGVGTLAFALLIGPVVHWSVPRMRIDRPARTE
ncbi:MAG: hypothetical protein GX593_08915 [Actinomycetales bacterium]|nr:hypothetical protein [Actinomycetales bacterium]